MTSTQEDNTTVQSGRKPNMAHHTVNGEAKEKANSDSTKYATTTATITTNSNSISNSNNNKTPEIQEIEQAIGPISAEYSCSLNHISGILYTGPIGVIFKGTIFFYQTHDHIHWKDVKKVQQTELGNIALLLQDSSEIKFRWLDQSSDKVWANLVSLHHEFINGSTTKQQQQQQQQQQQTPIPKRTGFRRISTEPIPSTKSRSLKSNATSQQETAYVVAATVATMGGSRTLSARNLSLNDNTNTENFTADLEDAWTQLHDDANKNYSDVAVKKKQIPCGLNKFFDFFYADDAPHSIASFMENAGDENLIVSKWQTPTEGDNIGIKSRTIEYSHPVNAPLAPPMARARKEQRIRRFGNRGISVETDTYVDDVPMTDCFYVTDRVLIAADPDGENVTFTAQFDIRFVKSTMFRAIIANTTRSEFLSWFQQLADTMVIQAGGGQEEEGQDQEEGKGDNGESPAKLEPSVTPSNAMKPKSKVPLVHPKPNPPLVTYLLILLVAFVLVTQFWILSRMSLMQRTMAEMQELCPQKPIPDCTHLQQILEQFVSPNDAISSS